MKNVKTYVVIPSYNEAKTIGTITRKIRRMKGVEVLVVDDGSTDQTAGIAAAAGARVLRLEHNQGGSIAIKIGLSHALKSSAETIVLMDADGQHDPRYIGQLVSRLSGRCGYVIGSRYILPTSNSTSSLRRLGTKLISLMIAWRFGKKVYDPTSGMRAMVRDIASMLACNYPLTFSEPEIVMFLLQHGVGIEEVSVRMNPRKYGKSSISLWRAISLMMYIAVRLLGYPAVVSGSQGSSVSGFHSVNDR